MLCKWIIIYYAEIVSFMKNYDPEIVSGTCGRRQIWLFYIFKKYGPVKSFWKKIFMIINNHVERGSENKYFLLFVRICSSLPTRTSPQYENILFSIKYWYTSNNFYAILARCWGSGLGVWFNLLGLKLLQCLDSLFFWILRNYTVFILTIHFWPSPQKLFKLFLQIPLKNCLAIV